MDVIAQHTATFHLPEFLVVKDLEDLSAISGPSSEPDPGVSTPTVAVSKDVEDTHHL